MDRLTDPNIIPEYITYPSPKGHGHVRGYLVRPAKVTGIGYLPLGRQHFQQ